MHTTKFEDGTILQHNGDYFGDVIIVDKNTKQEVRVDFNVLLEFVSDYIKQLLIEKIEDLDIINMLTKL